jgi:hypothetical protein
MQQVTIENGFHSISRNSTVGNGSKVKKGFALDESAPIIYIRECEWHCRAFQG